MKNTTKLMKMIQLSILTICMMLVTVGCTNSSNEENEENTTIDSNESGADENQDSNEVEDTEDTIELNTMTKAGENYELYIDSDKMQEAALLEAGMDTLETIYDREYQEAVATVIENYKQNDQYSVEHPLFILNPYGTTTTGLYVYFTNDEAVSVQYTISVEDEEIDDFTRILYTNQEGEALTEQEGIIIGLIPGMINTVTLDLVNTSGEVVNTQEFKINLEDTGSVKEIVLEQTEDSGEAELTDGLYVLFGYDRRNDEEARHLLFYDNQGVIRAEIPLDIKRADFRIENVDGYLVFPCAENKFVVMSPYGKIMAIYEAEGYQFHHDFAYSEETNKIVVLVNEVAKDTKEDVVLSLDLTTGEYEKVVDFQELLSAAEERAILPDGDTKKDWLHENTIMIIDGKDIIISSREISSIIRVNDIYGDAYVKYIISEASIWDGTGYEDLVYSKIGDFVSAGGQHSVTYLEDESLESGQYYLYMFNNNYGISTTLPDYDWSTVGVGLAGQEPDASYFYKYLVDENEGTYELVQSIEVPASRIVSDTQYFGDNIVICSGTAGLYGEYDQDGNLLAEWSMDVDEFTYRVMKYTMNEFWFNAELATEEGTKDTEKTFAQGIVGGEEEDEAQYEAFEDYSSATENTKGNDYSDFE